MIDTLGSKYARFFLGLSGKCMQFLCLYIYIYPCPMDPTDSKNKKSTTTLRTKNHSPGKEKNNHQKCICQPNKFVFSSCDLTQLRATYWLLVEIITLPLTVNLENDQKLKSKRSSDRRSNGINFR